ncbi:PREDICTED: zinc finger CCCH domain-containing protein 14-like [Tarenaya hassleriana]|uniref:zinc finger CCCH domain-containing protein 14-like n=1 Tax=Tarenaya hassleriana TaxID=28532 RepID=UPI00053CA65C|nr:PREDICTED: zinc finger CCCH domain-containing protein 14-like [Tarenaya hassleriana]
MEKDASLGSDPTSVTTLNSPPPPLSPQSDKSSHKHQEEFAANFASLYQSIFSSESQFPSSLSLSPSPPSSSSPAAPPDITTENRLHQARVILEYDCNELNENYELCLLRLNSLTTELESLRQENAALRLANAEILRLIHQCPTTNISSNAAQLPVPNLPKRQQISDFGRHGGSLEPSRPVRRNNVERTVLPKSISVRSSGYLRMNKRSHGYGGASRQASQHRFTSQLVSDSVTSEKISLLIGKGEKEAVELEVYRQGMVKTELCNKWQETGECPYGDHCQFAHGIDELRPVIRHPRYKTEVCRMIVNGATCPYGHRCHFRHSLTEQERGLLPR